MKDYIYKIVDKYIKGGISDNISFDCDRIEFTYEATDQILSEYYQICSVNENIINSEKSLMIYTLTNTSRKTVDIEHQLTINNLMLIIQIYEFDQLICILRSHFGQTDAHISNVIFLSVLSSLVDARDSLENIIQIYS